MMTDNPLDTFNGSDGRGGHTSFAGMKVGETRTVMIATREKLTPSGKKVVDATSLKPKTVTRTNRPFVFDWVDSTNEEYNARRITHVIWIVDKAGNAQLMDRKAAENRLKD